MLPALIEYLSSIEPGGGGTRICRPARLCGTIDCPPLYRITFTILPIGYMAIKYATAFSCIPNTMYSEVTQFGDKYFAGVITREQMVETVGYYIVFSYQHPVEVVLENQTPLWQETTFTQWQLVIDTEADFAAVKTRIKDYGTWESNALLKQMTKILASGGNKR